MTVSSSLVVSSPPSCRRVSSIEDPRLPRKLGMYQPQFVLEQSRKSRYDRNKGHDALLTDDRRCLETIGRCGIVIVRRKSEREGEEGGASLGGEVARTRQPGIGRGCLGASGAGESEL
jgi:hypothetical protein